MQKWTALDRAVSNHCTSGFKQPLDSGTDPNAADAIGRTPFSIALATRLLPGLEDLLRAGASFDALND